MKTEENNHSETFGTFAAIELESLTEEQIQYFASQLRKEYEFLEVEESEVFVKELSDLIRVFCIY